MRFDHSLGYLALGLLLACEAPAGNPETETVTEVAPPAAMVSGHHGDHGGAHHGKHWMKRRDLEALRRVTRAFRSIPRAEAAGYAAFGGCFQDSTQGGMGFHWANQALIADSAINPFRPELMVYQPLRSGEKRLAAVEYIVFVDEWHARGHQHPPKLFGQEFHINPTLLEKPFYLLHAWVWLPNPSGTFADWNPLVRCP